ncbi:MAG: hypothetical protein AB1405_13495, partial [Bdellovibrionota bacterium]
MRFSGFPFFFLGISFLLLCGCTLEKWRHTIDSSRDLAADERECVRFYDQSFSKDKCFPSVREGYGYSAFRNHCLWAKGWQDLRNNGFGRKCSLVHDGGGYFCKTWKGPQGNSIAFYADSVACVAE